jgi:hypothetical protein
MQPEQTKDIREIFREGSAIDEAVKKAAAQALRMHKLLGNPVAEWRDGKVVWVRPEDIRIPDEPVS